MLGDAYGAAIVEALSKKELEEMDLEREKEMDLESAETNLKDDRDGKLSNKVCYTNLSTILFLKTCYGQDEEEDGEENGSSSSYNGSSVEVPEVIIVDNNVDGNNTKN